MTAFASRHPTGSEDLHNDDDRSCGWAAGLPRCRYGTSATDIFAERHRRQAPLESVR